MNKQAYMLIAAIMLATVAGLSTAYAQTAVNPQLVVNVPFAFSVGEKTLPAGEYTVKCVDPDSSMKVLQFRGKDGHNSALIRTSSVNGSVQENARLVFHRDRDQYFFAQAWLPADGIGMQAPESGRAKARELAHDKRANRTVVAITRR
jgi:hypothetical protein